LITKVWFPLAATIARLNESVKEYLVPDIEKGELPLDPQGKGSLPH